MSAASARVDWVDYAKGFCIIFVVMMHSTLGVGNHAGGEGWLHAVVAFAQPFRMPDFFLISGLFLARVIDRDWRTYLDRKVVHFAYFYVLWVTIQFVFKAPGLAATGGVAGVLLSYVEAFYEPFGTLWFIYLLPIFFVVTKLARQYHVPVAVMIAIGAALEMAPIATGWTVIDEFAARFVYFYLGYVFAPQIFAFAAMVQDRPRTALAGLVAWGIVNGALVAFEVARLPVVSLALGVAGAAAVVAFAALLARSGRFAALRLCGRESLAIYLAFFLPMAVSRTILLKTGIVPDIGTMSVLVTAAGGVGALAIHWAAMRSGARFLFERPARFRLTDRRSSALQPAE